MQLLQLKIATSTPPYTLVIPIDEYGGMKSPAFTMSGIFSFIYLSYHGLVLSLSRWEPNNESHLLVLLYWCSHLSLKKEHCNRIRQHINMMGDNSSYFVEQVGNSTSAQARNLHFLLLYTAPKLDVNIVVDNHKPASHLIVDILSGSSNIDTVCGERMYGKDLCVAFDGALDRIYKESNRSMLHIPIMR